MHTTLPIRLLSATLLVVLYAGCDNSNPVAPHEGAVLASGPVAAQGPVTPPTITQFSAPVDVVTFNICTLEDMHLTGTVHFSGHFLEDGRGGKHSHYTANSRGVTAIGLTSGRLYRRVGASSSTSNAAPLEEGEVWGDAGQDMTAFQTTIHYVGKGQWPDFFLHETYHIMHDAQGRLTALKELDVRVTCDGKPLPEEDGAF